MLIVLEIVPLVTFLVEFKLALLAKPQINYQIQQMLDHVKHVYQEMDAVEIVYLIVLLIKHSVKATEDILLLVLLIHVLVVMPIVQHVLEMLQLVQHV